MGRKKIIAEQDSRGAKMCSREISFNLFREGGKGEVARSPLLRINSGFSPLPLFSRGGEGGQSPMGKK